MATTRNFQDMLNEYLAYDLLKESFISRDYLLTKVDKDDGWIGGDLIVPFRGAQASSLAFGGLTPEGDVSQSQYVRGKITTQPEIWGTLKFNHRELMEHNKLSEKNFLKLLPDEIDDFMDYMKVAVSGMLLNGPHFDVANVDGTVGGTLGVRNPSRFNIGQKIDIDDDNSSPVTGFVSAINVDTGLITVVTTLGGATPVDLSGYTVAQNSKVYVPGALTAPFSSLRAMLLSAANGGTATLYGQTKTAYPYLQSVQYSGASVTDTLVANDVNGLLVNIFKFYGKTRTIGKGKPINILMSFRNLGLCMAIVEASKGAFNVVPNSRKANVYGWDEVVVGSVTGDLLTLVGIQEMDDNFIVALDWKALKFHSNGFFKTRTNPDGRMYYETRTTSAYYYLVDVCLFGDIVLSRPSYCGIMYGLAISYGY